LGWASFLNTDMLHREKINKERGKEVSAIAEEGVRAP
jgi:hypothetical protein